MATKKPATIKKEKKAPRVKVTGFAPLKFKEYTITQKASGRYEVVNAKGANVNGADKVSLLTEAKLLKVSEKKAVTAETPAATT
jgi:hypothetical protein